MSSAPAPNSGSSASGSHSGRRLYAYRPALDGLRALAVLPVLFYHAGLDSVSGGFLGVDLFFVLSGYLITTLLIREWGGSGDIRLAPFWGRRARRLLPAVFLMLVAVLIYALFASPAEVARLRGDAFATLGYVANWWYAVSGESYFEQFGRPSMLRH
ncbi:MAG: acyltransferase, partial [Myxococcota bacterium]